jgi:hypothetical protein
MQTEIEFFFNRSKKILMWNFIILVVLLVIFCFSLFAIGVYWGYPIVAFPFFIIFCCGYYIGIMILRVRRNIRDYRVLFSLCDYADSLSVQSMESKED